MTDLSDFRRIVHEPAMAQARRHSGDFTPRRRRALEVPANLSREVRRLVWHLDDIGCVRSPFMSSRDCDDLGLSSADMCSRCRALRPYRSAGGGGGTNPKENND